MCKINVKYIRLTGLTIYNYFGRVVDIAIFKGEKMTKKKKESHVAFLLDQTGSMESCKKDTIGGFNNFLKDQKKGKSKMRFSMTLFNSSEIEKRYVDVDIQGVKPLSEKNYVPMSLTPLWDAVGNTMQDLSDKKDVLFVILTDGYENYSKEFKADSVRKMITEKEKDSSWKFLFLGADLANFNDAMSAGINFNFRFDKTDTRSAYSNLSKTVATYCNTGDVVYDGKNYKKYK